MATSAENPIVFYHYVGSPVSSRVLWYLALRGIPYTECLQPMIFPRPDIQSLGVKYRRIPVLAIGRDVYLDSRLILQKLQQVPAPHARLAAASTPEQRILERLLEAYIIDGGVFRRIVALLSKAPVLDDPVFVKDRTDLMGGAFPFSHEVLEMGRPDATNEARGVLEFFETTLLADGREWALGTKEPSLGDIEALWQVDWLQKVPGAFDPQYISATIYPKVFAWLERFRKTVAAAQQASPAPQTVLGDQAAKTLTSSGYNEAEGQVDESDPVVQQLGLKKGQRVQMWPTDVPPQHKDAGKLLSMNRNEIVIETEAGDGTAVRVHAPRRGFKVVVCEAGQ